jgi:hypothetical protein
MPVRAGLLLLSLAISADLHGQEIEGLFDNTPRELPDGVCFDNGCIWSVEQLLTYYGAGTFCLSLDVSCVKVALSDPRADVRSMAAVKLAKDRASEAIPWIADALSTEKAAGTRFIMARLLSGFDDDRGLAVLEGMCARGGQSDPTADAEVRILASDSVVRAYKSACNGALVGALQSLRGAGAAEANLISIGLSIVNILESSSTSQAKAIR